MNADAIGLNEACQEVSRYMMFLLMVRPDMLPGPIRQSRSVDALEGWNNAVQKELREAIMLKHRYHWVLKKILYQVYLTQHQDGSLGVLPDKSHLRTGYGPALEGFTIAEELSYQPNSLQVIIAVWVEMLCYVANHCSRESHASQLSSGGELVTIVWLMAGHANLANIS